MRFLELPQNTDDWARWRRQGIGASEAAAVLGLSPWATVRQLWGRKTGRLAEQESDFAMRRGLRLEPMVRRLYRERTGLDTRPVCVQHDRLEWMRASLDGLDIWGDVVLEIKCPNETAHAVALDSNVPDYYLPQVYHQLEVTGAPLLHYVSFSEHSRFGEDERITIVEVRPDRKWQDMLLVAEAAFWEFLRRNVPPPEEWIEAVAEKALTLLGKPTKMTG